MRFISDVNKGSIFSFKFEMKNATMNSANQMNSTNLMFSANLVNQDSG